MSSDPAISRREYDELTNAVRELTRVTSTLSQQVAIHNAEQKPMEIMVQKHEAALFGGSTGTGLLARTDSLERSMENINKAAWAFFAPAIALVFVGMLAAIYIALGGRTP